MTQTWILNFATKQLQNLLHADDWNLDTFSLLQSPLHLIRYCRSYLYLSAEQELLHSIDTRRQTGEPNAEHGVVEMQQPSPRFLTRRRYSPSGIILPWATCFRLYPLCTRLGHFDVVWLLHLAESGLDVS